MPRALAVLAVALATALSGCGDADKAGGGLAWDGTPKVFRSKNLPRDRVVIARVRNEADKTLHIVAADIKVRDDEGQVLQTTAAFATNYAHGLFGMLQQPNPVPVTELRRLGKIVDLPPGESAPFYAAWRLKPGTKEPVSLDYGAGAPLALPAATATAAGR